MSDLRIQYDEEMVGADHPTKSDTLNRLMLAEHDNGGKHLTVTLPEQAGDPGTGGDEGVVYTKDAGGGPELFYRGESDGSVVQLTQGGALASRNAGYVAGCAWQWASTSSYTVGSGVLDIQGKTYTIAGTITKSGLSGLAHYDFYFIKISAPGSGTTISGSQVELDAATPTWSDAYAGYYIGPARVIGWVHTDGSGNLVKAYTTGGVWSGAAPQPTASTGSPPTSTTAQTLLLPPLGRLTIDVRLFIYNGSAALLFVYNGDDTSTERLIAGTSTSSMGAATGLLLTNSSQQVNWKCSTGSVTQAAMYICGVLIPKGLAGAI